jgi:hypothetical protein
MLLIALGLARAAGAADPGSTPPAQAPEPGIWTRHQYTFNFMGFTTTYSCDGLEDKLKLLLLYAGARKDVKTRSGGCSAPFGRPDKFASAELTFYTLAPANAPPPPPAPNRRKSADIKPEPVTYGRGVWRTVELSPNYPRELGVGDCELIEQFRDHVLPLFTTRNLNDHTTCIPHQDSGSTINLKVELFAAAPGLPEVVPTLAAASATQ